MKMWFGLMLYLVSGSVALACSMPKLSILVGMEKPPYIKIEEKSGYELDLLNRIGELMGRCISFTHAPNGRLLELFLQGKGDLVSFQHSEPSGLYATEPYIVYEIVLIVSKKSPRQVKTLADLSGLRVLAFQNANLFLSTEYRNVVPFMASYQEVVNQDKLPQLLLKERVDALVMDRNIFEHYYKATAPDDESLQVLNLLGHNSFHLLGRTEELATEFNESLARFQQSSDYKKLQLKYFKLANQNFD